MEGKKKDRRQRRPRKPVVIYLSNVDICSPRIACGYIGRQGFLLTESPRALSFVGVLQSGVVVLLRGTGAPQPNGRATIGNAVTNGPNSLRKLPHSELDWS